MIYGPASRRAILVILVLAILIAGVFAGWTWQTVDRYFQTAASVRGLEFDVQDISWDGSARRLELELSIRNGGSLDVFLDNTRFSIYLGRAYIATNTDTILGVTLAPGEVESVEYGFSLRPFFADAVEEGLAGASPSWRLRGVVWVDVDGLRNDIPLVATKEVAP